MASRAEYPPTQVRGAPRVIDLGTVRISEWRYPPTHPSGKGVPTRECGPAPTSERRYHLSLTVRGSTGIRQLGREAQCRAGDLVLYDASRPFHGWAAGGKEKEVVTAIVACVPTFLLPFPSSGIDALLATRLPGDEGIGALLGRFLTWLTADVCAYRPTDAATLETVLLDLLTGLLGRCLEGCAPAPESSPMALLVRVQAYARRHLHDRRMSPQTIADVHHISLRYLHGLFREQGLTVASWIREQRLEHCRRDLIDPRLSAQPISAVARRWGFPHPPDFSRAFRARYGTTPRDYRREKSRRVG